MLLGAALIFFINVAHVQLLFRPDGGCDFAERLTSQQSTSFKNPHWPATYAPGTTCRWTFDCPIWYACRLRCLDIGLPQTDDCYMDKLMVSGSGNPQLEGAQAFCGRTEINFRSVGSRLTLALVASRLSPGGRFRCTIRSEPWTQPWFMSASTPTSAVAYRNDISTEEDVVLHKQKIITGAHANHRRLHVDLPHTGLIQSRQPYADLEVERAPHIKNMISSPLHSKHIKVNSSSAKHVKTDYLYAKRVTVDDFGYTENIRHMQAKSPYLHNVDDGSPRLENPESRKDLSSELPNDEFNNVEHDAPDSENGKPIITHVRYVKAQSQQGKSSEPLVMSHSVYHDNVEDGAPHLENVEGKRPHVRQGKAKVPPTDNFDEIKINSPYLANVEEEVPYDKDVDATSTHVRRAKAASPHFRNIQSHRKYNSKNIESVKIGLPSKEPPKVMIVNAGSPHVEDFESPRNLHHVDEISHIPKLRAHTPRLRRVKSGLPYADDFNPDQTLDLPNMDNIKEGMEILQAELARKKQLNAGLPYDTRTSSENTRRKHKIVSQIKHSNEGKHKGLKHVQKATRRVRHEVRRMSSNAPAGLPRLTHQRTGLSQPRRVHTHIKRPTKRPPIAPYRRNVSPSDESKQIYF